MITNMKIVGIAALFAVFVIIPVESIQIAISHCNDVSGQIESFKRDTQLSSKAPEPCEKDAEECLGGFPNIVHWLHQKNNSQDYDYTNLREENIFRFPSGNLIGGESGWIPAYNDNGRNGWKEYGALVKNHIKPSVLALGMKDFGAGLQQTLDYMNAINSSIFVLSNSCENTYDKDSNEEKFCKLEMSMKEIQVSADDTTKYSIGVIGFINPTVERLSLPGKLAFSAIAAKIKEITDKSDIKTFIALGDGTLDIAKQILDASEKVKLVIYGSGFSTTKNMTSNYPEPYKHGFIATAGRYGSSVGKMIFDIDTSNGGLSVNKAKLETAITAEWNQEALNAKQAINSWESRIRDLKDDKHIVGHSRVTLEGGENCWRHECNLGNLMTDAVVNCVWNKFEKPFNFPIHSIWHGGAFFEDVIKPNESITEFDIHRWLPYHNNVHLVKVNGSNLRTVFETSASGIDPSRAKKNDWRQFLQISNGMEVHYDNSSDAPKLVKVRIAHDDNGVPRIGDMKDDGDYYLAIPTYLYEGRGVYDFAGAKDFWEDINYEGFKREFDDECLKNYIKALKHISVGFEERIFINNESGGGDDGPGGSGHKPCECKGHNTAVTVILTILFFVIFLAIIYIGYFYVLPRLRRPPLSEQYPPNQL